VEIVCPTDATAKINAILSGRRGQILGFDTRDGWLGWDVYAFDGSNSGMFDLVKDTGPLNDPAPSGMAVMMAMLNS